MIRDHDRSGWFGASDVRHIMGPWRSRSFDRWWAVKLGVVQTEIATEAMQAGTAYEHRILDAVGAQERDRQILLPELRLRVNLDGNTGPHIHEAKTHRTPWRRPPRQYIEQVNVQMLAMGPDATAEIDAYRLEPEDYRNFFRPIDPARLTVWPVERDPEFLRRFLRRLRYLRDCLMDGRWPCDGAAV